MTRRGSGEDDGTFRVGSTYSNQVTAPIRAFIYEPDQVREVYTMYTHLEKIVENICDRDIY